MRVAVVDGRVDAAQVVAVGAGHLRRVQRVQDRLVVLVDQHRDGAPGLSVQRFHQMAEPLGPREVCRRHSRPTLDGIQLGHQVGVRGAGLFEVAAAEADVKDGMANRPIPMIVNVEPLEQPLVALEQLLARVQEQALAKRRGRDRK